MKLKLRNYLREFTNRKDKKITILNHAYNAKLPWKKLHLFYINRSSFLLDITIPDYYYD